MREVITLHRIKADFIHYGTNIVSLGQVSWVRPWLRFYLSRIPEPLRQPVLNMLPII